MKSRLLYWIASLCLLLLGLDALPARAQMVDLALAGPRAELLGAVEMLEDAAASLSPEAALEQPGWTAVSEKVNMGVTDAAVWFRLRVGNRSHEHLTRWVVLDAPLLEFVDFYQRPLVRPGMQPIGKSGAGQPLEPRQIKGKSSIFAFLLAPGEQATLLLRVQTRTRMRMEMGVWEPLAYREKETTDALWQLLPLSALAVLAGYTMVYAVARGSQKLKLLSILILTIALHGFVFNGYLQYFEILSGGNFIYRVPEILLNAIISLIALSTLIWLDLNRLKYTYYIFLSLIVASTALGLAAFILNLKWIVLLSDLLVFACISLWPVFIYATWRRKEFKYIQYLIISFPIWIAVTLKFLAQLGLIQWTVAQDLTLAMASTICLALPLSYEVIRRSVVHQKTLRSSQENLLRATRDDRAKLEMLASVRTQALQVAVLSADEGEQLKKSLLRLVTPNLRLPVNDITANAETIIHLGGEGADQGMTIKRSAQKLRDLMGRLIDLAETGKHHQPARLEAFSLQTLLGEIIAEAEILARNHRNRFEFKLHGPVPKKINADHKILKNALLNILENASKFTRDGHIVLSLDAPKKEIPSAAIPSNLVFRVSDTGVGIPERDIPRIFEPFWRSSDHKENHGLGLGLSTSRQWVEVMGGEISVTRNEAGGTTVEIAIPLELTGGLDEQQDDSNYSSKDFLVDKKSLLEDVVAPGGVVLSEIFNLIKLGAISDLIDFSENLQKKNPEWKIFLDKIEKLSKNSDLDGLNSLVRRTLHRYP